MKKSAQARVVNLFHAINVAGPFIGLLLVLGMFSLSSEVRPYLFTGGNLKIILIQTVIVAIGALGMTMIIVSGGIDLSVGSVVALTSVLGATLLVKGYSTVAAVGLTVLAGGAIGLVNGLVIAGFRMMPFIVTLGMMGVVRGLAKWLAGNQTVNNPLDSPLNNLMARMSPTELFPLPPGVWIAIGLAIIVAVVMRQSVFGHYIFAIGSNEATARLCGINVPLQKVLIYALAGLFFGLAGLMQLSRLTQGDPTVAIGLELDIIAAVVIGGASLSGGTGSILGSMIGALIMTVLRNGSNQMGWQNFTQEIVIGVVIIVAVGLDMFRQSQFAK
ncbi:MAG TPA: ABC transporter permease [Pirellulales bacterium]|jgi:ribose transport system permease protein|nr:ABC transporter permease [Pirellulales bacterium]